MAGHEWEDWFEREEFIGQISDIRVQNLQVEREVVQKRTFTRWMNLHLEKCDPPTEVKDLFRDIQDGRILMALLEELSGCQLLHGFKKSSHRIFRLNNIAKVLTFLEERNVKLVSIDAADIADGNSSIILGLIWNIILFFQIKELTGNIRSQFPSTSSLSSIPTSSDSDTSHSSTPSEERRGPPGPGHAGHGRAIKKLLQWVQKRTRKYGVAVQDFGKSWTSGLAFLAVIKSIDPTLVDMRRALLRTPRENLEEAFRTAHYTLGIPRLLEPEDVTISRPEEQCIMTYVSQFLEHFPGMEEPEQPSLVIERSVSMGRLNTRDLDADHQLKNSLDRSRLKKRPHGDADDKDWPQHPAPRIFVSSVSEDHGVLVSLAHKPPRAGGRSWASEDSVLDPGPAVAAAAAVADDGGDDDDAEPRDPEAAEVFTISASQPSPNVHSPAGSSSAVGDSAIGSPDWWQEEGGWAGSPSDGSLCDSGTAWDVGRASPAEEEPAAAAFSPDAPPEEPPDPEMFVDEGVGSLSSMESAKERRAQPGTEREEEGREKTDPADLQFNESRRAAARLPEEKADENKAEVEHEGVNSSRLEMERDAAEEPHSLKLCNGSEKVISEKVISEECNSPEPMEADRSQPELDANSLTSEPFFENKVQDGAEASSREDTECTEKALDPSGVIEELSPAETTLESGKSSADVPEAKAACQSQYAPCEDGEHIKTTAKTNKEAIQNSQTQGEPNEGGSGGHADMDAENTGSEISENQDYSHAEQAAWPMDDVCQHAALCSSSRHASESDDIVFAEIVEVKEDSSCDSYFDLSSAADGEVGWPTEGHPALGGGESSDPPNGTPNAADAIPVAEAGQDGDGQDEGSGADGWAVPADGPHARHAAADPTHADGDAGAHSDEPFGQALEPMDLFYPDKEDAMFAEPDAADADELLPSVFGVFALQPAPASEPLSPDAELLWEETEAGQQRVADAHFDHGGELAMERMDEGVDKELESRQLSGSAPKSPAVAAAMAIGGTGPLEQVGPPEDGHLSGDDGDDGSGRSPAKGNTEPVMSSDEERSRQPGDDLIPTVLRHRKATGAFNSSDKQMIVPIIKINSNNADLGEGSLPDRELYLLLLLWLLLYCLLLLPQMELRALPGLLFNLDN